MTKDTLDGDVIVSLHTDIHVTLGSSDMQHDIWCHVILTGTLHGLGLSIGHFTHVFVDEAGQATEPECLVPISLLAGTEGNLIPNLLTNLGMSGLAMGSFVTKCGILEYPCTMASYTFPLSGSSHAHRLCWQGTPVSLVPSCLPALLPPMVWDCPYPRSMLYHPTLAAAVVIFHGN